MDRRPQRRAPGAGYAHAARAHPEAAGPAEPGGDGVRAQPLLRPDDLADRPERRAAARRAVPAAAAHGADRGGRGRGRRAPREHPAADLPGRPGGGAPPAGDRRRAEDRPELGGDRGREDREGHGRGGGAAEPAAGSSQRAGPALINQIK